MFAFSATAFCSSFNTAPGFVNRIGNFVADADKLSANDLPVATISSSPATPASSRIARFVSYLDLPASLTMS